jgi:predicted aspartyl protease
MDVAELLRQQGAIVDVEVGPPASIAAAMREKGQTPPARQIVKGLVDTGASISTVDEGIAVSAGLQPTGTVELGGVGGSAQRTVYAARFGLPQYGVEFDPIEIAGVSIAFAPIQVLIGRDVLKRLQLDYSGPEGAFALTENGALGISSGFPLVPVAIGAGAIALTVLLASGVLR